MDTYRFFSPNCSCMVALLPPLQDNNGCEYNIFFPSLQPSSRTNYFGLDIASYAIPHWWSLPFGWIAFFPLCPSFSRPIFENLIMPGPYHAFNDKVGGYSMPLSLSKKWLWVNDDLSDAIHIVHCHYHSTFIYPLQPSGFGFLRTHQCSGALHMSLCKSKD